MKEDFIEPTATSLSDDEFLRVLYASVTDDEALGRSLAYLAGMFRCRAAALAYVDPAQPEADVALGHGAIDAAAQKRYREYYGALDPAPAIMAQMAVGTASTTHRLFDQAMRDSCVFYNEFFRGLGLVETLGGPVVNSEGRFAIAAVQRGDDRPPFSDDEIHRFEGLMPHLAQAIELRRTFFEISDKATALASAVDSLPVGLMIFRHSGRLAHANLVARRLVDRADGLLLDRAGRLSALDGEVRRALTQMTLDPPAVPQLMRVPRRSGRTPYALRATKAGPRGAIWKGSGHGLLLAVHDPEAGEDDVAALLSVALDLTAPASRLVAALMAGADLDGYATSAGISVNTAKFHLKSAFAATETRRQVDLVRRATAIVRDLTTATAPASGIASAPPP